MAETELSQSDVITFLSAPSTHDGQAVTRITTHISEIFLTPKRAYKLKRAITLPFLDYASLEARASAVELELLLNRRTAPELYRGRVAVTHEADGRLALDGAGEPVDWLVVMTRFPSGAEADHMAKAGQLTLQHAARLADHLVEFHQDLTPNPDFGEADALRVAVTDVKTTIRESAKSDLVAQALLLADDLLDLIDKKAERIEARRRAGKVRRCHGDLHLGNIVVLDDDPVPFDCIEFSERIATIDILFDLAFPVMDLLAHDLPDHANLLLNRYLAATREYDGLDLFPLYLGTRALIRLMVELRSDKGGRAQSYLQVGQAVLQSRPAELFAVGGLSGSGKSTVARALAPLIGAPPGAILLRSDEIRKRLQGVAPEIKLPTEAYTPAVTRTVFDRLESDASLALARGASVILDATHMSPQSRLRAEEIAVKAHAPFRGLWLDADISTLESRVAGRVHDASDATVTVLHNQQTADLGDISWTRLDAHGTLDSVIRTARAALGL